MSGTYRSALFLINPEVQQTLGELSADLTQASHTKEALNKLNALVSVLALSESGTLKRYCQAIYDVVLLLQEQTSELPMPTQLQMDRRACTQSAVQVLQHFLRAQQVGNTHSELSLFSSYRLLREACGELAHPIDLCEAAWLTQMEALLSSAVPMTQFQQQAKAQRQFVTADALEGYALDALMLALVRQKDEAAARKLDVFCAAIVCQSSDRLVQLQAALMSLVLQALVAGYLELDTVLKRCLLTNLKWLKAPTPSMQAVEELIVLVYVAWQQKNAVAPVAQNAAQDAAVSGLAQCAKTCGWTLLPGSNYNRVYFGKQGQSKVDALGYCAEAAQTQWKQYCADDAATPADSLQAVQRTFAAAGQAMLALHPAGGALSEELEGLVKDSRRLNEREVQVEVMTLWLMVRLLCDESVGAASHLQWDVYFADLARRIRCVRQAQATGAFDPWMLQLQTTVGVRESFMLAVDEMKLGLTHVEQACVQFWAGAPSGDVSALQTITLELDQLQAVANALKLQDFALVTEAVRRDIHTIHADATQLDEAMQHRITQHLAQLGLMLDMVNPSTLSTHDAFQFKPVVQSTATSPIPLLRPDPVGQAASGGAESGVQDESIEQIFISEVAELLPPLQRHLAQLEVGDDDDNDILVEVRRAFHTLKGGARIVGYADFGEAAWLMERCLNAWLAEKKQVTSALCHVLQSLTEQVERWCVDMATCEDKTLDAMDWQLATLATRIEGLAAEPMPSMAMDLTHMPLDLLEIKTSEAPREFIEDEQTKHIGHLSLSIALYNAFLMEADEWSRQLVESLSEWALTPQMLIPSQSIRWAHSLAGSSGTVGLTELADITKSMEHVMERLTEDDAFAHASQTTLPPLLVYAAEEVRRSLHQFAAGFLKLPDPALQGQLQDVWLSVIEPAVVLAATPTTALDELEDAQMGAVFQEEAEQILPDLGATLRAWSAQPQVATHRTHILRLLHTLKGSARLVGRQAMAQTAHDLESHIEQLPSDSHLDAAAIASLTAYYDKLQQLLHPLVPPASGAIEPAGSLSTSFSPTPKPQIAAVTGETIRIKTLIVDRLVNQTGEIMIARARMSAEVERGLHTFSDLTLQVQRLREQLRELELQTESQMQSRQTSLTDHASGFDPLELDRFTRSQELTRFMAEALSDVATLQRGLHKNLNAVQDELVAQSRQTVDLQRHLLSTRMVEFNSVSERLHRTVRLTAAEMSKSVQLVIEGGWQELDRSVLDPMLPAFEHLLRNAVVHGIESPAIRKQLAKPEQGLIRIQLAQSGNDVLITIEDDGQGIDASAVQQRAKDLLGEDQKSSPMDLIFVPGLSTSDHVSELAGRGIGMDIVKAQTLALGGRIEVESKPHVGTSFKLVLPLTTAVTQILLLRAGVNKTAIPVNLIVTTLRMNAQELAQAQTAGVLVHAGHTMPLYQLSHLLQYPITSPPSALTTVPVIILQSARQMLAVQVDEVLGSQEAVIKNLGSQLSQMPGLSGMTVLPTGETVLIYNPVALASVYGERVRATESRLDPEAQPRQTSQVAEHAPLVLVVDDSITMRRVLQRLLLREGYRVSLAADGRQALDELRAEQPCLVLSDVEMPRMDGFELLRQIRGSEQWPHLPVIMITSRMADKHRDHAKQLGANEYLGKPYAEEELLMLLRQYAGAVVT